MLELHRRVGPRSGGRVREVKRWAIGWGTYKLGGGVGVPIPTGVTLWPWVCRLACRRLATQASPYTPEASLVVETGLLTLGAVEPSVPQLSQDSRALHRGLEPLEEVLTILSFTKRYE